MIEETEETEELEETEKDDKPCWCFGDMDLASDKDYEEYCKNCDLFNECFFETYGETYTHYKVSEKREESKEHIETFLEGLSKNKLHVTFDFSKSRKLIKIGQLSFGITIPKILNEVYPRGSEILVYYCVDSKVLLFFGEGSFVSEGNREILVNLYLKGYATFRSVVFSGNLNVLIIPRQWTQYFNTNIKVNPQFDSSCCTLFLKSNLTDIELEKLEREKQAKSYLTHSSVAKTDSKILGYKDSREFKEMQKWRREGFS